MDGRTAFPFVAGPAESVTLSLVLPLGISFYTFRTLSYLLDVNSGRISATQDWVSFFCYVAFFPTLISGPIDRAGQFIPQLERARTFSYPMAADAMRIILWGLFKKVVVADNCAIFVDSVFKTYSSLYGIHLVIAVILFAIQAYCDFSGYSDMALGFSRLLGFKVMWNFNFPYFSRNISEF